MRRTRQRSEPDRPSRGPQGRQIRVLVAAPHRVVRSGYRHMLEQEPDVVVVAEARTADEAVARARETGPAVAIVDFALPPAGGFEATRRVASEGGVPAVLLFAPSSDEDIVMRAWDAGAMGFISRESERASVIEAVRQLAEGKPYLSQELMQQVALQRISARGDVVASLSPREFEIFRLLATGRSVLEIARLLALSPRSVANYQTQVKRKLRVTTSAELVHLAIRRGVIQVGEA